MVDLKRNPVPSLLESLQQEHLDPGYAAAAKRKASTPAGQPTPRTGRAWTIATVVAACVLVGVLFGVSASSTETNAPRAEKTRSALLEDIDRAQQRQSELAASATSLAEVLRATQSELGASGPLQTVAQLENASQITPVTGPGLRIVIDDAKPDPAANAPTTGGVIQDRDVQLLVNDLWAAGAEAISIGGVRLQPRSAIRQAGGSILVDNRPVFWPITIEAIGDPAGMQVKSISSPGFGRFSAFSQLYGIEFDVTAQQTLNLPGGSGADLLYARPPLPATTEPVAPTTQPTTQPTSQPATGTTSAQANPAPSTTPTG